MTCTSPNRWPLLQTVMHELVLVLAWWLSRFSIGFLRAVIAQHGVLVVWVARSAQLFRVFPYVTLYKAFMPFTIYL